MRRISGPNWWAASALLFCLASWSAGIAAVTHAASLYEHRSAAGFRHDLLVHAKRDWTTLENATTPPRVL